MLDVVVSGFTKSVVMLAGRAFCSSACITDEEREAGAARSAAKLAAKATTEQKSLKHALIETRTTVSPNVMAVCAHCYGALFTYSQWVMRDGRHYCNTQCADRVYRSE
jgi:hypothetical protein